MTKDKTMAAASSISPSLEDMLGIKVREVRSYTGGGGYSTTTTLAESRDIRIVRVKAAGVTVYRVMVWEQERGEYVVSNNMGREAMLSLLLDAAATLAHD